MDEARSIDGRGDGLPRAAGPPAALLGLVIAACASPDVEPLRIGVFVLTAPPYEHASGVSTREAVTLFADSVNAAGGVTVSGTARPIELVFEEHSFYVEDATTAARRLINLAEVHALVGPQLSDHAIPVAGIADRAGVPMISPMSSNPETTRERPFVFRVAFVDDVQARVLASVARNDLGLGTVGVLFDRTSDYSSLITERFTREFEALGGRAVPRDFARGTSGDVRAQLTELAEEGVEAILLPNQFAQLRDVLPQIRELGITVRLLGTDGWDVPRLLAEPAAQGAMITHQWSDQVGLPETDRFVARYTERFGQPPRATAALTYDATRLLVDAAGQAGSLDGDAIRRALAAMPPLAGVSGVVDLGPDGDPNRTVMVTTIEDGGTRLHRLVNDD